MLKRGSKIKVGVLFMFAAVCLVMKILHSLMLTGCFRQNLPKGEIVIPMSLVCRLAAFC